MDVREKLVEVLKKCGVCNIYAVVQLANALADNGVTVQEFDGCDFCKKFDFAEARAEVNKYGAHISLAICNTKFPDDEQFKFCPMCGRKLPQPPKGE